MKGEVPSSVKSTFFQSNSVPQKVWSSIPSALTYLWNSVWDIIRIPYGEKSEIFKELISLALNFEKRFDQSEYIWMGSVKHTIEFGVKRFAGVSRSCYSGITPPSSEENLPLYKSPGGLQYAVTEFSDFRILGFKGHKIIIHQ